MKTKWVVYILECADHSLYTGVTNNLEKRFSDHQSGKGAKYTKSHKPIQIVYQEEFETHSEALKREIEIKSWTREQKIKWLNLMSS